MKFRPIIILFIAIAGLYACNKASDDPVDTTATTLLNVINTTSDTLNYYLNGTRQNSQSSIYTGGATGYLSAQSGLQNYQFRKNGQNTVLFSLPLTLDTIHTAYVVRDTTKNATTGATTINTTTIKGYSLYVNGESTDKTFLKLDTVKVNSDSATVRFVHTANGVAALDMHVGDASFTNQSYGNTSKFKTQLAGANKVITVNLTGSSVINITQKLTLLGGTAYTFYVKGVPGGVGKSALTVGVFINSQ
ncbi:DUF4397 domain-containing protein [Mucilaginibacter polytrichastri]|uniref:DUF4397 domain-containing protein n=1 Tax=Mucilaginibacter polytrichastri TaxID=1302689 RepID=A0A1Q5ZTF3_9SPHI|nr:DUF4397 domain-containing protein [Mucilaginibacter polytrichastri]OKS85023.1 hypothetical protein RG47T_0461 [Mucilaginibacter polytrichastri]SFS45857.1 hypothetical protein SAMN04487890_101616 [Mucilaginibacter polytrichastri]